MIMICYDQDRNLAGEGSVGAVTLREQNKTDKLKRIKESARYLFATKGFDATSTREIAALAGLAPYDNDSCSQIGARHIKGGRKRLRGRLYSAALPASFRWNAQLIALYQRLIAKGKSHKTALIACARKLLIFVNTVIARGEPWTEKPIRPVHVKAT